VKRKPVSTLVKNFIGKVFADKGYILQKLADLLALDDITLITMLKCSIIETINDRLKYIFQLEYSMNRSLYSYIIDIVASLVTYSYQLKKPSLNIQRDDLLSVLG